METVTSALADLKLDQIPVYLLKTVAHRSEELARLHNIRYARAALCVPFNWGPAFQATFLELFRKAFNWGDPDTITFLYEAEGLAHYFFQHKARTLRTSINCFLDFCCIAIRSPTNSG